MRLLKIILAPLSLIYGAVMTLRNFLYDRGWLAVHTLPATVISIGNITVGGTGKTPLTVALADWFRAAGYSVAILSRGYGRKTSGTVIATEKSSWDEIGDEPAMMRDILGDIPIVVDENRYRGGQALINQFHPDVILLDDAFQHRALHRDVDLLAISAGDRPSDHFLFPRGKLREPWRNSRRADAVLLTKTNWYEPSSELEARITALSVPVFRLQTQTVLQSPYGPIESCDMPFILVCAIADPESFRRAAGDRHLGIAAEYIFSDHHHYVQKDITAIESDKKTGPVAGILTTEKDYVKLKQLKIALPVYVLSFQYILPEAFQEFLKKSLPTSGKYPRQT